jgi:hypothetical protein
VVLKCGHRFHAICGDMWCAKCADKGWGVTCPGCREASNTIVQWSVASTGGRLFVVISGRIPPPSQEISAGYPPLWNSLQGTPPSGNLCWVPPCSRHWGQIIRGYFRGSPQFPSGGNSSKGPQTFQA